MLLLTVLLVAGCARVRRVGLRFPSTVHLVEVFCADTKSAAYHALGLDHVPVDEVIRELIGAELGSRSVPENMMRPPYRRGISSGLDCAGAAGAPGSRELLQARTGIG